MRSSGSSSTLASLARYQRWQQYHADLWSPASFTDLLALAAFRLSRSASFLDATPVMQQYHMGLPRSTSHASLHANSQLSWYMASGAPESRLTYRPLLVDSNAPLTTCKLSGSIPAMATISYETSELSFTWISSCRQPALLAYGQ